MNGQVKQQFYFQRLRFLHLVNLAPTQRNAPEKEQDSPPRDVIAFAEKLAVCPTEETALAHIQADLSTAKAFLSLSETVAYVFDAEHSEPSGQYPASEAPFLILANEVRSAAQAVLAKQGNRWH